MKPSYGCARLLNGLEVTFGSSDLPHGLRPGKGGGLVIFTPEASMTIPERALGLIVEWAEQSLASRIAAFGEEPPPYLMEAMRHEARERCDCQPQPSEILSILDHDVGCPYRNDRSARNDARAAAPAPEVASPETQREGV